MGLYYGLAAGGVDDAAGGGGVDAVDDAADGCAVNNSGFNSFNRLQSFLLFPVGFNLHSSGHVPSP